MITTMINLTNIVCGKCGKTVEYDQAAGWLIHQRINQPEGHLIIRCPEHITGHALRLAGLPQQTASKRVLDNIDRGFWVEYGYPDDDYSASTHRERDPDGRDEFKISYHKGDMPAFNTENFSTIEALIMAMRKIEPDIRKWRLT